MKRKKEIPVYLICGFLDAGKTEFLKSVLTPDGLADGSVPCCSSVRRERRSTTRPS